MSGPVSMVRMGYPKRKAGEDDQEFQARTDAYRRKHADYERERLARLREAGVKQRRRYDKAKAVARVKRWKADNPEKAREMSRLASRKRRALPGVLAEMAAAARGGGARLTIAMLEELRSRCGGRCEVCGRVPPKTKSGADGLHVDHRHSDGAIRGLLCASCNRDLAAIDKGEDHLKKLIEFAARDSAVD